MYIKHTDMICSVQGCKNTDTMFLSKNKITFNTPNVCRECVKNAYFALIGESDAAEESSPKKTMPVQAEKPDGKQAEKSSHKPSAKISANPASEMTGKTAEKPAKKSEDL